MSIVFHCEFCNKKIEAPDNAGGKWGKCPACHNKVYVPGAQSGEELKLAPIDEEEQARQEELLAETAKVRQDILLERDAPYESGESELQTNENEVPIAAFGTSDEELRKNIVIYLCEMANGELVPAEQTAELIVPFAQKAVDILDKVALGEILEPELGDIPSQVLSGLIRDLRAKMS